MTRKTKKRSGRSWWQKPRNIRRAAIAVLAALVAALGLAYVLVWGKSEEPYNIRYASHFALPTTAGDEATLGEHLGRHNVLLYFSEGIGCGACWDQIVDLEEKWPEFAQLDIELVSIMIDPLPELAAEAQARGITVAIASDTDKSVSRRYDALEASMHPGVKPGHTFVLVRKDGTIAWRWDWFGHGKPMYVEVDDLYNSVKKALARQPS